MPSKRSRSKERERKRKLRANKTEEERVIDRHKAKEGMQRYRSRRSETDEQVNKRREQNRIDKREMRMRRSEEEIEIDNETARVKMKKIRKEKGTEVKEFERIKYKHVKRVKRQQRSGKEHLLQNLKAKKGMQLLKDEGRLKEFSHRSRGKFEEIRDWEMYSRKGERQREILKEEKPDIVDIINERVRLEKENERKRREREKEGEWCYNGESGEYYWSGEGEPNYGDTFTYEAPTAEELQKCREEERKIWEALLEEKRENQKDKRKKKQEELQAAVNTPVQPLPERELCPYEKLRESNIKERQEAMEASGFFEDINNYKSEIGFTKVVKGESKKQNVKKNREKETVRKICQSISNIEAEEKEDTIDKDKLDKSQKNETKLADPSKSIYANFYIEDYYLHDCLE